MRTSFLNFLLLSCLFGNLLQSFEAQPVPTPSPNSHFPAPTPNPILPPTSPTPAPVLIPKPPITSPLEKPVQSPTYPLPPPSKNAPEPEPPAAGRGGPSGLSGGQKAGIVIGTLLGAALLGLFGLVCWKRQSNVRRNRYSNASRNIEL
ncbi:alpha carbonic anhydrase 8-like [Vicia villosa]|uniref:alpha carbonic anhydrase 8-like n=1 Tax=Vicia villosa TaxID=3911 RepID=UPI00273B268B|nr:alpha carbonic anhydrase 8-like [Vicia villosa]